MESRDLRLKGAFLGHGRCKENGVKLIRQSFDIGPRNRISCISGPILQIRMAWELPRSEMGR